MRQFRTFGDIDTFSVAEHTSDDTRDSGLVLSQHVFPYRRLRTRRSGGMGVRGGMKLPLSEAPKPSYDRTFADGLG